MASFGRRPRCITFEGKNELSSKWTYRAIEKRCPRKGEYYLSGAVPQAYKAPNDLTSEYWIVEPLCEMTLQLVWLPRGAKHED